MQSAFRLKKNRDFRKVFRFGKSEANSSLVLYVLNRGSLSKCSRVGVSVSKRVGGAVTRNRIRRLVKEVLRGYLYALPPTVDLVVIARKPASGMSYDEIKLSLVKLLRKFGFVGKVT